MLKPAIQEPLTKADIRNIIQFLSYHLNYVPKDIPDVIFCKTAKEFADLYETYKKSPERIDEININYPYFYDHITETIVFQGFSYHEGLEIPQFIVPMSAVIHECIHFFQYATGTFGSYCTLYEGTNEILSCFLMDDYRIDYQAEAKYAFNLAMELSGHDFWRAMQWMKTYTVQSDKNRFAHRTIKQCATFAKHNPKKLLSSLDDYIISDTLKTVFNRYSLKKIIQICKTNREVIRL